MKEIIPVRSSDVTYSIMEPDIILLNIESGYYFSTNHVGAKVWELCNGKNSITEILCIISKEFKKDIIEIEDDIVELIESMTNEGLLLKSN